MADIALRHEVVDTAVDEMMQATNTMRQNMHDLIASLVPISDTFKGASATAWTDLQNTVNAADSAMNDDFGQGHVVLAEMHNIHKTADNNGAAILHP